MTRWLVTGAGGMLGQDVLALLPPESAVGLARSDLDITSAASVRRAFVEHRPDVVVNCAAWTAVDSAESHEAEALAVNGDGPRVLAEACTTDGTRLLQVSTDYVFAGDATSPYAESAAPAPRTAYGRTKLAGEQAVLSLLPRHGVVVRAAWLYGVNGPNFVATMIRLESQRETLDVVADQRGQPTWTGDVAARLLALGSRPEVAGVFHATNAGEATWHELAQEVFRLLGADPSRVRPIPSSAYKFPTPRPAYSVLGHDRWSELSLPAPRPWQDALREAFPSFPRPEQSA